MEEIIIDNNSERRTGTKEWSEHSANIDVGCENDCRYCYARANAIRFKQVKPEEWATPRPNRKGLNKPRRLDGRIMFPTTHDITKNNLGRCVKYLKAWLSVGNEFLIVSKPDPICIATLCQELAPWKDQIMFRFTIGSMDDGVIKFWERNAPPFRARLDSLKVAYFYGFRTSVSCEPFLDGTIRDVVMVVSQYVTDTIWIGKMNRIRQRVDMKAWTKEDMVFLAKVECEQTDEAIGELYGDLCGNWAVRWKDSIKAVMGIPQGAVE